VLVGWWTIVPLSAAVSFTSVSVLRLSRLTFSHCLLHYRVLSSSSHHHHHPFVSTTSECNNTLVDSRVLGPSCPHCDALVHALHWLLLPFNFHLDHSTLTPLLHVNSSYEASPFTVTHRSAALHCFCFPLSHAVPYQARYGCALVARLRPQ
jgi:hypothetical protein